MSKSSFGGDNVGNSEVGAIIGPQFSGEDLLPLWQRVLRSDDAKLRHIALRHTVAFLDLLHEPEANDLIGTLLDSYEHRTFGWRERLEICSVVPALAGRKEAEFIYLFEKLIRDPTAAVRLKVVQLVCSSEC